MEQTKFDFESVTEDPTFKVDLKKYINFTWYVETESSEYKEDDDDDLWPVMEKRRHSYSYNIGSVRNSVHENYINFLKDHFRKQIKELDPFKEFNIPKYEKLLYSRLDFYETELGEIKFD